MTHREKIGCMAADGSPIDLSEAMIFEWDIEQDRITCTQSNGVEVVSEMCVLTQTRLTAHFFGSIRKIFRHWLSSGTG